MRHLGNVSELARFSGIRSNILAFGTNNDLATYVFSKLFIFALSFSLIHLHLEKRTMMTYAMESCMEVIGVLLAL